MIFKNLLMDRTRMAWLLVISSIATVVFFALFLLFVAHAMLYVPACDGVFSLGSSNRLCQMVAARIVALWILFLVSALLPLASLARWLYLKLRRKGNGQQNLQPQSIR